MHDGEYLSSNSGIAYPFKQDQNLDPALVSCFVDAMVDTGDPSTYRITRVICNSAAKTLEFTADGTRYSFNFRNYDGPYAVVGDDQSNARFVLDVDALRTSKSFVFAGEAELHDSCFAFDSGGVNSITLYYGENDPRNQTLDGDITLCCGYNMEMSVVSDTGDEHISVVATPGSGLGVVPCTKKCSDDSDTDGHRLTAENGNAVITGDGCYEVTAHDDIVQIHGKCVACCQCQDFIDILGYLKGRATRVSEIKTDVTETQTTYYYDLIERLTTNTSMPDLDIQMDISPSPNLAYYSRHKNEVGAENAARALDDFEFYRVTVVVTNLSGIGCYIQVPGYEIPGYPNSPIRTGYRFDRSTIPEEYLFSQGITTGILGRGGILLNGFSIGSDQLKYVRNAENVNGWIQSSVARVPTRHRRRDGKDLPYQTIGISNRYVDFNSDSYLKQQAEENMSLAINDLNARKNSANFFYDNTGGGADRGSWYYMSAGHSFSVTNTYAFPAALDSGFSTKAGIMAMFLVHYASPGCAYSMAYNRARPTTTHTKTGKNEYKISTTWSLPEHMKNMILNRVHGSRVVGRAYYFDNAGVYPVEF